MKIGSNNTIPTPAEETGKLSNKRKGLNPWLLVGIGPLVMILLFFGVFIKGGHLYKTAQTQHFKQTLDDLSQFNFSFMKKYAKGQLSELDDIKIDIKFKHLMRINYLRSQAAKEKFINSAFKDEEFPARLTYKGKTYTVKISLTGKMSREHLGNPSKWSFQVKARGDQTIAGMKRFGLLIPTARGNLTDWLSFELMKERGLMGLRIDFVSVAINGKSHGIFYLEERFDKHLLEHNRLREGIIFKIEKEILPYGETKLMQNPDTRAQLLLLKNLWQNVMAGHLPPQQFFDVEKMARLFVLSDLLNNQHPLSKENLRFYFNPVSGLVEPIAREFEDLAKRDASTLKVFLEKPDVFTRHFWHKYESIIGFIYNNPDFKQAYIREAEVMSQKQFLDDFFQEREEKINAILHKVYRTWPYYDIPKVALYKNQAYINSVLFPEKEEMVAYFDQKKDDFIRLQLNNQQDLPLEINYLSWQDSVFFYPEKQGIIDSDLTAGTQATQMLRFKIPDTFSWTDDFGPELKVHYHMLGLEAGQKQIQVLPKSYSTALEYSRGPLKYNREANYSDFSFIQEQPNGNILSIPPGKWILSEDLIIPKNKYLEIAAGAEIDLIQQARIISYSPVFSLGKANKPVIIHSSDGTGKGLRVIAAKERSNLSYTHFDQLAGTSPMDTSPLKGAISFYQSPVSIRSSTFSNLQEGENFLHIIESDFTMDDLQFENINADAFEGKLSNGSITQSTFSNIGENAIDISGTRLQLTYVYLKDIGKTGIKAMDNSQLDARWLDIRGVETAISGEDQSRITMMDTQVQEAKTGITLLHKSPEYGPVNMIADRLSFQQTDAKYNMGPNTLLMMNGKRVQMGHEQNEESFYRAEFGHGNQ